MSGPGLDSVFGWHGYAHVFVVTFRCRWTGPVATRTFTVAMLC